MEKTIILYGMRGTGKSSIGRLLSQKLDKSFIDLDEYVGKKIGEEIQTYIEKKGWDEFRDREYECLKEILENNHNIVLSLGGGTVIFERNQKLILKNNYKLIYIYSDIEKIQKRIQKDQSDGSTRNSLTGGSVIDELAEIYEKRKGIYEALYDFKVVNNESVEQTMKQIEDTINHGNVCVPIINYDSTLDDQIDVINTSHEIKYVELRIDFLDELDRLYDIIPRIHKQIILTNRTSKEGGKFGGDALKSCEILSKYSQDGIDYVDFELLNGDDILELSQNLNPNTKLILSYHNFEKTPDLQDLQKIIKNMSVYNPQVYKMALMPKNQDDVKIVYELCDYFKENYPDKDYIFISMGELGMETRIRIPEKGGLLTFGSLNGASAPGQIYYKDLYNLIFN